MARDEIDIVEELVNSIPTTTDIIALEENAGVFTVTVCNTLWLNDCSKVVFNSVEYKVTSVAEDYKTFTMKGTGDAVTDFNNGIRTLQLPELSFVYGTYREANKEIVNKRRGDCIKFPLVFMLEEPLRSTKYGFKDVKEIDITTRIFLLQKHDKKWTKEDHRHKATKGMMQLADVLLETINEDRAKYNYLESLDAVRLPEFSVYTTNQGKDVKLLDTNVSGVGLSFTLEVKKHSGCCSKK